MSAWLALLLPGLAAVQDEPDLKILWGHSRVLDEPRPVRRIAVGDPSIVGVLVVSPKQILLNGQRPGRTNLIVWYEDETRSERLLQVEYDLSVLRGFLSGIDPSLTVQTSPDGGSLVLRGTVDTPGLRRTVEEFAKEYVGSIAGGRVKGAVVKPGEAETPESRAGGEKIRLVSHVKVRAAEVPLEQRLEEMIRRMGGEVRVRRVASGPLPDDARDTFVLEGSVQSQSLYTRILMLVDRALGGPGKDFEVIGNEGGGLHGKREKGAGQPQPSTLQPQTLVAGGRITGPVTAENNLDSNFARATAVMGKTGRWVSFIRVTNLPQVLVTVRVLELDRNRMRKAASDLSLTFTDFVSQTPFSGMSPLPDAREVMSVVSGLMTNTLTLVDDKILLTHTISALEQKGFLRTLSEPNLVTLSGETADFVVGGEVPISTTVTTTATALQGFFFREFGIRLTIRPIVDGDTITIDVIPEITDIAPPPEGVQTQGVPVFSRTSLETTAQVRNGEGLILGGLISTRSKRTRTQVPVLGDIPLLGELFAKSENESRQREIAIVLIPRIVTPKPASAFALRMPPEDFPVRAGVFNDPKLGQLKSIPDFFNIAEDGPP